MTRTSSLLLAAVAIVAVFAPVVTAIVVGGWSPIKDIDDPHIQKLGRWAVSENNRLLPGDALTFRRVTGGEQQVVDGMNYRLDIDASSGRNDINGSYKAVVYEQDWTNTRKLISFDKTHS